MVVAVVLFKSAYPSLKLGTYWRRAVLDPYAVRPRIATAEQSAYAEKAARGKKRAPKRKHSARKESGLACGNSWSGEGGCWPGTAAKTL